MRYCIHLWLCQIIFMESLKLKVQLLARGVGTGRDLSALKGDRNIARTGHDLSALKRNDYNIARTGRDLSLQDVEQSSIKIKSLSELMGAYKTTSSKQIHLSGLPDFKWQRSFHDHIIRNEESFFRISDYIQNNPLPWKDDKFYNNKKNGEFVLTRRDRSRPVPTLL